MNGDHTSPTAALRLLSSVFRPPSSVLRFPARPLFWLTAFFMLGIGSRRLLEGVGRIGPEYFALVCLALIAVSLIFLKFPGRVPGFPVLGLLFLVFGMWAAQAAAPELPHPKKLDPFFERQLIPYIAEISAPPEHYPAGATLSRPAALPLYSRNFSFFTT